MVHTQGFVDRAHVEVNKDNDILELAIRDDDQIWRSFRINFNSQYLSFYKTNVGWFSPLFQYRGLANNTDLNASTYYSPGFWSLQSLSYINKPTSTNGHWGMLVTFASSMSNPNCQLIITPADNPHKIFVRRYAGSSSGWNSWST